MTNEYELKFLNVNKSVMREQLQDKGYVLTKPETLMRRQTFHLPTNHVEHESKWGRVRDEGDKITATVKWYDDPLSPSISDVHETEIEVGSWDEGVDWITSQGFTPTAYQENTREAWKKPSRSDLEVVIDTWPGLNPYVEIEAASAEDVAQFAKELRFNPDQGIAGGTELVYASELGIETKVLKSLPSITFQNPPSQKSRSSIKTLDM